MDHVALILRGVGAAFEREGSRRRAADPGVVSGRDGIEAELDALDKALQPWDAFLVYSIKQVALDSEDSALRRRLFTLLLDSRYLEADGPDSLLGRLTSDNPMPVPSNSVALCSR